MLNPFLKSLYQILKQNVNRIYLSYSELIIEIDHKKLNEVLLFFKNHENCLYKLLVDIVIIDLPQNKKRFSIVYNLCSLKYKSRLKIIVKLDEITPICSITNLYKNANWMEREAWDMYGIYFEQHPDLRRILTDYGFEGFPLRKDFPLSGFKEVRYDDSQKRVVFEPIEMTQEFRIFNFNNPWNKQNLIK